MIIFFSPPPSPPPPPVQAAVVFCVPNYDMRRVYLGMSKRQVHETTGLIGTRVYARGDAEVRRYLLCSGKTVELVFQRGWDWPLLAKRRIEVQK